MARELKVYTKSPEGQRAVLTVLDVYRVLLVPGKPDLTSITDAKTPVTEELLEEITGGVKPLPAIPSPEYQLRSKSGPNGQAVRSATLDAKALEADPLLDSTLKDFLRLQGASSIAEDLEQVQQVTTVQKPTFHSKLSAKQEPGGKVRIFAIVDYYSQIALKPLHNEVARLLSKLPQDYT